jgi:hypothetical protein
MFLLYKIHKNTLEYYIQELKLVKYSLYEAYNKNNVLMYMFLKETIHPKGYNIFNKTINTYITEMENILLIRLVKQA